MPQQNNTVRCDKFYKLLFKKIFSQNFRKNTSKGNGTQVIFISKIIGFVERKYLIFINDRKNTTILTFLIKRRVLVKTSKFLLENSRVFGKSRIFELFSLFKVGLSSCQNQNLTVVFSSNLVTAGRLNVIGFCPVQYFIYNIAFQEVISVQ